jgi:hypothetical protein
MASKHGREREREREEEEEERGGEMEQHPIILPLQLILVMNHHF